MKKLTLNQVILELFGKNTYNPTELLSKLREKEEFLNNEKTTGTYYTPPKLAQLVCESTLNQYSSNLIKNKYSGPEIKHFSNLKEIIRFINKSENTEIKLFILTLLSKLKIIDIAVGTGYFLQAMLIIISEHYEELWKNFNNSALENSQLNEIFSLPHQKIGEFRIKIRIFIINNTLFGTDLNNKALKLAKKRILLSIFKNIENLPDLKNVIISLNFKEGNSLSNNVKWFFGQKFNLIIGNPPHGADIKETKITISQQYLDELRGDTQESTRLFILRCLEIGEEHSSYGLIIPKQFAYNDGWQNTRKIITSNYVIESLIDLRNSFSGQKNEHLMIIWSSSTINHLKEEKMYTSGYFDETLGIISDKTKIPYTIFSQLGHFPLAINALELEIITAIFKNNTRKLDFIEGNRGLGSKYVIKKDSSKNYQNYIPVYEKRDVDKFSLKQGRLVLNPEENIAKTTKVKQMKNQKIIAQRISSFTTVPVSRLITKAYWDPEGKITKGTNINIYIKTPHSRPSYPFLCILLNSSMFSWYIQRFIYSKWFETSKDLDVKYLQRVHIFPISENEDKLISRISIILHFLQLFKNINESGENFNKEHLSFFLTLADCVVFEKYFYEQFIQDNIINTSNSIVKQLEPLLIQSFSYSKLREKYLLLIKEDLIGEEKTTPTTEFMQYVNELHHTIENNKNITHILSKIQAHKWTREIYKDTPIKYYSF